MKYFRTASSWVIVASPWSLAAIDASPVLRSTVITYGSTVFRGVRAATATTPAVARAPATPAPTHASFLARSAAASLSRSQTGTASVRDRVWQDVKISLVAGQLKK